MFELFCAESSSCSYYNAAAASFNDDISAWDTGVTTMKFMFLGASSFNQPIGIWSVDAVTNMRSMFNRASSFNKPLDDWKTSNVISMRMMFRQASSFNQPIGDWRVDSVTSMYMMFYEASAFDQDLSWCVDDDMELEAAFNNTQCESTSCGVIQNAAGTCAPSPAPTPAPTVTPRKKSSSRRAPLHHRRRGRGRRAPARHRRLLLVPSPKGTRVRAAEGTNGSHAHQGRRGGRHRPGSRGESRDPRRGAAGATCEGLVRARRARN